LTLPFPIFSQNEKEKEKQEKRGVDLRNTSHPLKCQNGIL